MDRKGEASASARLAAPPRSNSLSAFGVNNGDLGAALRLIGRELHVSISLAFRRFIYDPDFHRSSRRRVLARHGRGNTWFFWENFAFRRRREPRLLEVERALGRARWQSIVKIALPSPTRDILAGLRLGLTVSLILALVCEMIAGLGSGCCLRLGPTKLRISLRASPYSARSASSPTGRFKPSSRGCSGAVRRKQNRTAGLRRRSRKYNDRRRARLAAGRYARIWSRRARAASSTRR